MKFVIQSANPRAFQNDSYLDNFKVNVDIYIFWKVLAEISAFNKNSCFFLFTLTTPNIE